MQEEVDLYAQYQSLTALVSVLLHDLRNPLHSATLLVEAMGMRTADVESLRGKLRSQFAKLDALISEANGSIRELQLDTRPEPITVSELLASTAARLQKQVPEVAIALPPASDLRVSCDPTLLACAMTELAVSVADQAPRSSGERLVDPQLAAASGPAPDEPHLADERADERLAVPAPAPEPVVFSIDEPEPGVVRVAIGPFTATDPARIKAPFSIASGGVRMALARGLVQQGGGSLRLDRAADGVSRYTVTLKRAP